MRHSLTKWGRQRDSVKKCCLTPDTQGTQSAPAPWFRRRQDEKRSRRSGRRTLRPLRIRHFRSPPPVLRRHSPALVRVETVVLLGISFFIPSAPFPPKARGRRGFAPFPLFAYPPANLLECNLPNRHLYRPIARRHLGE
jgi:hypothetical protein